MSSTKSTTSIYFAAALLSLGAKLEKTDRTDPRHMEFYFSSPMRPASMEVSSSGSINLPFKQVPTMDLDKLETEWVNKSLNVNAFDYAEAIQRMKSIVHSR